MTPRRAKAVQVVAVALGGVAAVAALVAIAWPVPSVDPPGGVLAVLQADPGQSPLLTHGDDRLPPRPATSPQAAAAVGWPCEGDGTDGQRVQWVYGYSGTDNLSALRASFEQYARNVEQMFLASSGGQLVVRYVTGSSCALSIDAVPLSPAGLASFDGTVKELTAAGYNRPDRKYHVWTEGNVYCGIGTVTNDDQAGDANAANGGPSYSRSDRGCWDHSESHELIHNLGGVQLSAPNSTGGWHCKDGYDLMCYADGAADDSQVIRCDLLSDVRRLDCRDDDYFAVAVPETSYLYRNWNVARSQFLASATSPTTVVPPTTVPPTTVPPTTSTTTGKGKTSTVLSLPESLRVGQDVRVSVGVSGACDPSGTVEFRVSGAVVSRQVLERGQAVATLRFTRPGRYTVRATYSGSDRCATSTASARKRVTG